MQVKICGIKTEAAAIAAAEAGADAVGFVFARSPRRVSPERAAAIAAELPRDIDRVAVFYRPNPGEIRAVADVFHADVVQADHAYLDPDVPVRQLPVFRESIDDVDGIHAYLETSTDRRLLYEGPLSGVGERVDLEQAKRIASHSLLTLAGGLDPSNVAGAITAVQPYGVDVSSGVESEPGVKNPGLIREFLETVRLTEKEMVTR